MHEIATDGMPPRHVAPFDAKRVVLEEEVVCALVIVEAIGVVRPVH